MRDELRRLHRAAGAPSKSALKAHADAAGHHVAESTLIGLISSTAKGHPRRATVEAFVDACLRYAARHGHWLSDEDRDRLRWIALFEGTSPAASAEGGFAEARAAYLGRLHERFGRVDTETLLPLTEQELPPPIRLRELFVPQYVRADPPPLELPRGLLRQLLDSHEIDPEELPADFDQERLRRTRAAYRERPARPVLKALDGPAGRRTVVLGDPGAGKSTLARYVALAAAEVDGALPILIELRAYAADTAETFLDLIDRRHHQDGLGLPGTLLEKYLRGGGPALVVFDGLDEIFDLALRREVTDRITGFAARYPQIRVLVTSRVIGYRRTAFDAAGFQHLMLQDFDDRQVEDFARRWYEMACPHDRAEAARLADRLRRGVHAARPVRELAGNPLLLTILAVIARRTELPRDRRTAYEHAVTVLVEHWEVDKSLVAADAVPGREEKLELLRLIARSMLSATSGPAGNHIAGRALTDHVRAYLSDTLGLPVAEARKAARNLLDQLRTRNFILSHFGGEVYGFVHRAFLEYLAAADIVARFDDRVLSEEDFLGVFGAHWRDPAWHEVLLLVTGMKESFADRIIDYLLDQESDWFHRRDGIPHHLLLAIRCLGEIRRIGRLTAQSERIAGVIARLLEAAVRQTQHRREGLDSVVERTASPVLTALGANWPGRHRYRDWYLARGRFLGEISESDYGNSVVPVAARIGATVLADDADFRGVLLSQALTAQQAHARVAAVNTLVATWPDDADVLRLVHEQAVRDPSPRVRRAAAMSLLRSRSDNQVTVGLIRDRAKLDASKPYRFAVIQALANFARDAPVTRPLFVDLARTDPDGEIRGLALSQLARCWPDDDEVRRLVSERAVDDSDPGVRRSAKRDLTRTWPGHPEIRPMIDALADSSDGSERVIGLTALARSGSDAPGIRSLLRKRAATDPDSGVRLTAFTLLVDHWPDDPSTVPTLVDATDDPEVAPQAMQFLVNRWPGDPRALDAFEKRVRLDDRAHVRSLGAGHLARALIHRPGNRTLLGRLATEENDQVRARALSGLAMACPDDPDILDLLRRSLTDAHRKTRQVAVAELATGWPERHPDVFELLRRCALTDPVSDVRAAAVRAVAEGLPDVPDIGRWLRTVAENDSSGRVRAAALAALAPTWLADDTVADLFRRAATGESDIRPLRVAVAVVADVWRDEPGTLPIVHALVRSNRNAVRAVGLRCLAIGWRDHPDTLPILRQLAESDRAKSVQRAAAAALEIYPMSLRQRRTGREVRATASSD
ncbi:HEAT repeat domain-containing protein [Actinoplanes sp. CA-142083]|uniref:NACHT domain-containing protein n=1 Tax=Actinoplanes sp. CA-142083 TaxID=3239903 RepID=UPI003D946ADB